MDNIVNIVDILSDIKWWYENIKTHTPKTLYFTKIDRKRFLFSLIKLPQLRLVDKKGIGAYVYTKDLG